MTIAWSCSSTPRSGVESSPPIGIQKLRQRTLWLRVIQPHRNESPLPVKRVAEAKRLTLQRRPVRSEGVLGHAQHQYPRLLQGGFDLREDAVAELDLPFVEPDSHAIRTQPLGQFTDDGLVVGAVAQEYVVREGFGVRLRSRRSRCSTSRSKSVISLPCSPAMRVQRVSTSFVAGGDVGAFRESLTERMLPFRGSLGNRGGVRRDDGPVCNLVFGVGCDKQRAGTPNHKRGVPALRLSYPTVATLRPGTV